MSVWLYTTVCRVWHIGKNESIRHCFVVNRKPMITFAYEFSYNLGKHRPTNWNAKRRRTKNFPFQFKYRFISVYNFSALRVLLFCFHWLLSRNVNNDVRIRMMKIRWKFVRISKKNLLTSYKKNHYNYTSAVCRHSNWTKLVAFQRSCQCHSFYLKHQNTYRKSIRRINKYCGNRILSIYCVNCAGKNSPTTILFNSTD